MTTNELTPQESALLFRAVLEASRALTQAGLALTRAECDRLQDEALTRLLGRVAKGELRLELRVGFQPVLSLSCEVIEDATGELVGTVFEHVARSSQALTQ